MLQLEFTDKMVPYDVFVKDLAREIVMQMNEASRRPSGIISQNQAFKYYGAGNVRRWVSKGMIVPLSKRPGKVEYRVSDLDKLQQKLQDYF
jgi:hypothetical protein